MISFHLHLVSDSTGETANMIARACLVNFVNVQASQHVWRMVRSESEMEKVVAGIRKEPGFVLYTVVDDGLRRMLEDGCRELSVPCVSVLDPFVAALGGYLGAELHARPGRQYALDAEYFNRMEAMHFVLNHDDGQSPETLNQADVVLVGVSRTSKTPTSIYLANRGIRAANVPLVPGSPLPPEVAGAAGPLIVGLTVEPKHLVQIRRYRLHMLGQDENTDYVDLETVKEEVREALKVFSRYDWPVIDVTRRSVEEIAANILQLYGGRLEERI